MTQQPKDQLGRFSSPAPSEPRIAELAKRFAASDSGTMPAEWRALLFQELAACIVSGESLWPNLTGGVLTSKGRFRAGYNTYLRLADRIAQISRLLGIDDGKTTPPELTLAEQFAEEGSHHED